ncbi:shikimate kinase [Salinithrix halophila]|uniref:Shikimate kinase n=1 Tax=Salinithrix halophila TaxID=1485204 RepID=A0ABV8JFR6_9BACL
MTEQQQRHLVLIGFMGTGKSSVGRYLGQKTGLPVTDTDGEVEKKADMSIPQIFEEEGEAGFREREHEVLQQVLGRRSQIITTGGGVVLRPDNVRLLREKGWVVALDASEQELTRRLSADRSRPLLTGDVRERVARLKRERQGRYDFAHRKLDTTQMSPKEAAEWIWKEWKAFLSRSDGEGD